MIRFVKKYAGAIIAGIVILTGYYLATDIFGILDSFLFYGFSDLIPLCGEFSGKLLEGFKSSMCLLIPSYVLAVVTGIAIGSFLGLHRRIRENANPYIYTMSAIPVTLLTPYAINLLPTFRMASLFIMFLGCFWIVLGTTQSAVRTIDKRYLETAETLEIKGIERLFRVILPAASPGILSGCTIALKFSFMLLTVSEMYGVSSGLGFFIQNYSSYGRFDLVAIGFWIMGAVLVMIMYVFDFIKAKILVWTINN